MKRNQKDQASLNKADLCISYDDLPMKNLGCMKQLRFIHQDKPYLQYGTSISRLESGNVQHGWI
jgi:hypothetical protein